MKFTNIEIRVVNIHRIQTLLKDGRPMSFEFLVLKFETTKVYHVKHLVSLQKFACNWRGFVSNDKAVFYWRDTRYREKNWRDFRKYNRAWNLSQNYCFAPYDIASWLIQSISANLPLYQFIGAMRDSIPIYGSSMTLKTADDYAKEALDLKKRLQQTHPPLDYEITPAHKACRKAVGVLCLMSDPVNNFSYNQNLHLENY